MPVTIRDSLPIDTSFASESLIEEPVTSGGESGLWDCEDPADERCIRPSSNPQ